MTPQFDLFDTTQITEEELKAEILKAFKEQGLFFNEISPDDKEAYRKVQEKARIDQLKRHYDFIVANFKLAKDYCRDGAEIDVEKIQVELREIQSKSFEDNLFKWWELMWWSTPYQAGYGRRMRFFLWDTYHNCPLGLIFLQSPLFKLAERDNYLGLTDDMKEKWINKSMDAHRVGALPPYNELLGGKLVAITLTSNEIRKTYETKYKDYVSVIKGERIEPQLLFITTMSALGRSSIYNRLKYKNEIVGIKVGYTKGFGTFHIPENLFEKILIFLKNKDVDISRSFLHGSSKRMKLLIQALRFLGLSKLAPHGLKREIYIFPLAKNLKEVIHQGKEPVWVDRPLQEITNFWKTRYAIPRSQRKPVWKNFNKNTYFKNLEKFIINLKTGT